MATINPTAARDRALHEDFQTQNSAEHRSFRPVVLGAWVGAALLAIEIYAIIAWIVSGDARATPTGSSPFPGWQDAILQTWQWGGLGALALFVYFVVIRPWRREGHLTLNGLFAIAFAAMSWLDGMANYFVGWTTYNSHFVNLGSFYSHVPGWLSPNSRLIAFPLLWLPPAYVYLVFGEVLVAGAVMRRISKRFPNLSNLQLALIIWVALACFDIILEPLAISFGLFSYAGSVQSLCISGFPVYGSVAFGATVGAWTCLRHFCDASGFTLAERGADQLRIGTRTRTVVRILSIYGTCSVIFLALYIVPTGILALHGGPWPKSVINKSYMTDELCGPGTTYACSGPLIPIPRPGSLHIGPNEEVYGG